MEFKRVVLSGDRVSNPHRKELSDELAAFANSRGGTLVLGVDDVTREVVGIPLEHLDAVERWVCEICNDTVTPPLDAGDPKTRVTKCHGHAVFRSSESTSTAACLSTGVPADTYAELAVRSVECRRKHLPDSSRTVARRA